MAKLICRTCNHTIKSKTHLCPTHWSKKMGEFSYICKQCNTPINAEEACIFFLLVNGEIVEFQKGHNSNYGGVSDYSQGPGGTTEWKYDEWTNLNDLHHGGDISNGFAVFHQVCYKGIPPTTLSANDPNQGWGRQREKYSSKKSYDLCQICFKKIPKYSLSTKVKKYCDNAECQRKGMAKEV